MYRLELVFGFLFQSFLGNQTEHHTDASKTVLLWLFDKNPEIFNFLHTDRLNGSAACGTGGRINLE